MNRAQQITYKISEVAPKGWEGTVLTLKKRHADKVDNPWALSYWMRNQGYKSHKTKTGKEKRD